MKSKQDENRQRLEQKVRDARHMSKPEGDNVIVFRAHGRWLFEVYPGEPPGR